MARKVNEPNLKRNCFNNALQLLFKYDSPSDEQVYHHLYTQDHCPTEHCSYLFGFKEGRSCEHVAKVKEIISKLLAFRSED
jgi:hypothetical protein